MLRYLAFACLTAFFLHCQNDAPPASKAPTSTAPPPSAAAPAPVSVPEPPFVKEGELALLDPTGRRIIYRLDIEIAQQTDERTQGLMFRRKMDDKQGMLFLFERPEPQSFWMRNTYIPLDIIYVNEKLEIVSIQKNAPPLNEKPLPSAAPAQYVLEINGGLCDKIGIKPGSKLAWRDYVNNQVVGSYDELPL
jgi:hypothetical protein